MATIINASTSSGLIQTADTSGVMQLQSNGTTMQTVDSTGSYGQLRQATAQATTSGTSITFSSIPSWVKRITVMFNGVSVSGTSQYLIQLGTSSGAETTGYLSNSSVVNTAAATLGSTSGFIIGTGSAAAFNYSGLLIISTLGSNVWVASGSYSLTGSTPIATMFSSGSKTTASTLDRIIITTTNGTDTFDAGSVNILYEG